MRQREENGKTGHWQVWVAVIGTLGAVIVALIGVLPNAFGENGSWTLETGHRRLAMAQRRALLDQGRAAQLYGAAIERATESFTDADAAFYAPEQGVVGQQFTVTFAIGTAGSAGIQNLVDEGATPVEDDDLRIAPNVKATLTGSRDEFDNEAFRIRLTSAEETVVPFPDGEWEWSVLPLVAGHHTLTLVVHGYANRSDDSTPVPIYDESLAIFVQADTGYQVRSWWSKYWQWLIGTVGLTLFALYLNHRRKSPR